MRIKLLRALSGVMKLYPAGRVVEWDDVDADRLIKRGAAVAELAEESAEEPQKVQRRAKK